VRVASGTLKASYSSPSEKRNTLGDNNVQASSRLTFGSRSSSRTGSNGSMEEYSDSSTQAYSSARGLPWFQRIIEAVGVAKQAI
jgi:hypothetical protein